MTTGSERNLSHARRHARRLAMQALYQWQLTAQPPQEIHNQFREDQNVERADLEYFRELLYAVVEGCAGLDAALAPHLTQRAVEEVDPVERAILRLAAYELLHRIDVPYRVVVNEAVELAKKFGAAGSHKFVNGVLDKLARDSRALEFSMSGRK